MGYIVFSIGFFVTFFGVVGWASGPVDPDMLVRIHSALYGVMAALGLLLCALGLVIAAIREQPRG